MIADAVDTAIRIGWALAAWIAVLAAVGTIVVLAATATGAWAWHAVRRRPTGPSWAYGTLQARIRATRRTRAADSHTTAHSHREAA
ncbi:hypothetical protein ACIQNU_04105 [Streptomyces sp. NPDC091292]|uniref:hypothetical protein n=1 Tax=Streptomyces sp. NPDC091292 TaxID=3365991 RepID=UPI00380E3147